MLRTSHYRKHHQNTRGRDCRFPVALTLITWSTSHALITLEFSRLTSFIPIGSLLLAIIFSVKSVTAVESWTRARYMPSPLCSSAPLVSSPRSLISQWTVAQVSRLLKKLLKSILAEVPSFKSARNKFDSKWESVSSASNDTELSLNLLIIFRWETNHAS